MAGDRDGGEYVMAHVVAFSEEGQLFVSRNACSLQAYVFLVGHHRDRLLAMDQGQSGFNEAMM